ncbi:GSCOCG00010982001-RA-CDS, partial [Cotesia congregata]
MKRNNLTARCPESISKGRAVITKELIRGWFSGLQKYLEEEGVADILEDPTRILNGDETSLQLCPKTGKVIAPVGYKNVYQVSTGLEKEAITVLLFFTASGETLPPCVVFPYIRPPRDLIESMPDEWILGKSETGWMKTDVFYDYCTKSLNPWLTEKNIKRPVLVLVDGHKSHLTLKLSEFCAENQIILYPLPPNTTHMMQPADVSVFKPLNPEWQKTVRDWQMQPENLNSHLSKNKLCPLLKKLLDSTNLSDTIKNGFKRTGLYPFDPDAIDYTKCVQNNREN